LLDKIFTEFKSQESKTHKNYSDTDIHDVQHHLDLLNLYRVHCWKASREKYGLWVMQKGKGMKSFLAATAYW